MAASDTAKSFRPYVEELLENGYARENLREAMDNLRGAYARARKRRVKAARDERVRQQLKTAALSIAEVSSALRSGRQKPKRRWGRRLLFLAGLGAVGVGVALAADEELRASLLGSGSPAEQTDGAAPTRAAVATPA
jgi:hypothetical protein